MEIEENLAVDSRSVFSAPDMNYEKRRLETFRFWPSDAKVDPQRIAKAGFYSTDNPTLIFEVKCFSCGKCISDWEYGDQVMAKHRIMSPECPFVVNPLECGNVPLLPPIGSQADYRKEAERLASFRGWPSPHVTAESLARNGLYYLREDDKVSCAFCSVVLHEWQAGDDPLTEHRRNSPNCPLLFGYIVGNVPLDFTGSGIVEGQERNEPMEASISSEQEVAQSTPDGPHVEIRPFASHESSTMNNKSLASNPQFGAQAHKPPIHTTYQTYEARLASFREWPNVRPTPDALASAGFFYQGMLDHASCFHCNGGLHNWDPTDDPWEEHARWFSRCPYVGLIKGRDFIHRAMAKKPPVMPISQMVQPQCSQHQIDNVTSVNVPQIFVEPTSDEMRQQNVGEDVTSFEPPREPVRVENTSSPMSAPIPVIHASRETSAVDNLNNATSNPVPEMDELSLGTKPKQPQEEPSEDLAEENRRLTEARCCKVCLDEEVGVVFLPCGHLITCVKCAPNLAQCPMCREKIQATVRTFFS